MNATQEQWRPIPGYEGLYEVSDQGRVRSVDRLIPNSIGPGFRRMRGRELTPSRSNSHGHLRVQVGRGNSIYVHRAVLLAFVGDSAEGQEACHINDDPSDNRLSNLRWGSRTDNVKDMLVNHGHYLANKTHCIHGHEFTEANTLIRKGSSNRACRTCAKRRIQEYKARRIQKG